MSNYECRTCGYVPSDRELHNGTCPHCSSSRRIMKHSMESTLETLPVGSSVQVSNTDQWGRGGVHARTLMLWKKVGYHAGYHADGSSKWHSCQGYVTFTDKEGREHQVYAMGIQGLPIGFCNNQYTETKSVTHFSMGEVTYGAWITIHDTTPTTHTLAAQRIRDSLSFLRAA